MMRSEVEKSAKYNVPNKPKKQNMKRKYQDIKVNKQKKNNIFKNANKKLTLFKTKDYPQKAQPKTHIYRN